MTQLEQRILQLIAPDLKRLATRESVQHVRALARCLAQSAPDVPAEKLAVIARFGLFTFAFDRLLDDAHVDDDTIELRTGQLTQLATFGACSELVFDSIGACLQRVIAALPWWSPWRGEFVRTTVEAIVSSSHSRMMLQQLAQGRSVGFSAMLDLGRRSIGLHPIAVMSAMLFCEDLSPGDASAFDQAMRPFANAMRIASDLRPAERDRCNLLFTVPDEYVPDLDDRIKQELSLGKRRVALLPKSLQRAGSFVCRFTEAMITFYAMEDFAISKAA